MVDQSSPVTDVQQAVPVAQEDREFAAQWIVVATHNAKTIRAGDWDHHHGVQAAARHRLASLPCKSGEGAEAVAMASRLQQARHSAVEPVERDNVLREAAILLRRFVALTPDATQTREAEFVRAVKDDLRGPDGEEYTDSGIEDAFFRWPVIERALRAVLNARGSA